MFGFVARKDPAQGAHAVNVARVTDTIRGFGLAVVVVTVWLASPRPGSDGPRGLAVAVVLALSAAAWVAWLLSGATGDRRLASLVSLIVMGAAGGVLAGLSPNSPAVAVGCAACFSAGVRLRTEVSLAIVAETIAGLLIAGLVTGAPGRGAARLFVRLRRAVERGPDPPPVRRPGRTSRADAGRDPPRP